MNWFKCNNCGEYIREDDLKNRVVNEGNDPPFREYALCCPVCDSEDVEQIDTCPLCGTPFDDVCHYLCADCQKKTKDGFTALINILFDDRYGAEGDPAKENEVVSAILEEIAENLISDASYEKSLARREI